MNKNDLKNVALDVGGTYVGACEEVTSGAWGLEYDGNDYAAEILPDDESLSPKTKKDRQRLASIVKKLVLYILENKHDKRHNADTLRACVGWLANHAGIALNFVSDISYNGALKNGIKRLKEEVLTDDAWIDTWKYSPDSVIKQVKQDIASAARVLKSNVKAAPLDAPEASKSNKLKTVLVNISMGDRGAGVKLPKSEAVKLYMELRKAMLRYEK